MSASPDTGDLAAVLRQLVALAGDHPAEETLAINEGAQSKRMQEKPRESEEVEPANSWPPSHDKEQ